MNLEDFLKVASDCLELSSQPEVTSSIMRQIMGNSAFNFAPAYADAVLAAHGDHRAAVVLENRHGLSTSIYFGLEVKLHSELAVIEQS